MMETTQDEKTKTQKRIERRLAKRMTKKQKSTPTTGESKEGDLPQSSDASQSLDSWSESIDRDPRWLEQCTLEEEEAKAKAKLDESLRTGCKRNLHQIIPNLFLGSFKDAKRLDVLKSHGVTHIINISDFDSSDKAEAEFKILRIRIPDIETERINVHFETTYKFIEDAFNDNGVVFVHCTMGISRSVSIVVAYLMKKLGGDADKCLAIVKNTRRIACPNDAFMKQLRHFEATLSELEFEERLKKE